MRENLAVAFVLAFLWTATSLMAVGLVAYTIKVKADADGFVTWHKVFYDQAMPAAPQAPAPSAPVVHITDDPGGSVMEYYRKYKSLSDAGTEIHFHGGCFSSCTIVLFSSFTGIRACADEGAIFGFHKPFTQQNGKVDRTKSARRATRKLWAAWLEELPNPLRRYLQGVRVPSATEGDETNTMLIIPASLLLPKCALTVAAQ
ncbi:MAG: hypothetical protein E5X94_00525 [Mesorhizobium sp.]|uniref:hypothetical protein n=1 Tax=Mesorhizobium sp. TaxID=1871066 RepID=UPI00122B107F|nr:hypothetical protein [Mesorhizobium sp.]TIN82739.1 MAG: hypothetical protein E5X97_28960 [Mesorhizobium sp.]TIN88323.1 MAG: hypothetical protein E5X94_00525 [Mesorhizobium sp.]